MGQKFSSEFLQYINFDSESQRKFRKISDENKSMPREINLKSKHQSSESKVLKESTRNSNATYLLGPSAHLFLAPA